MDTCTHKIVLKKNSQGQIIFLKKKAFCKIKVYRSLKKNKNTKLLADVKKEKKKLIESWKYSTVKT